MPLLLAALLLAHKQNTCWMSKWPNAVGRRPAMHEVTTSNLWMARTTYDLSFIDFNVANSLWLHPYIYEDPWQDNLWTLVKNENGYKIVIFVLKRFLLYCLIDLTESNCTFLIIIIIIISLKEPSQSWVPVVPSLSAEASVTCAICIAWLLLRSHILAVLSHDAVNTLLPS